LAASAVADELNDEQAAAPEPVNSSSPLADAAKDLTAADAGPANVSDVIPATAKPERAAATLLVITAPCAPFPLEPNDEQTAELEPAKDSLPDAE
jgi:hypothetical protein